MAGTDWEQPLREVLEKIAIERKLNNTKISIQEISSGGANYTSKLFTAVIKDDANNELQIFAKVATLSQNIRELMSAKIYNSENLFYMILLKKYRQIEDSYGLTGDQKLNVPEFYGCDPTEMKETLVLENLVAKGYQPYDRFGSMDWDYASTAISELAKFHALSFAFNSLYPDEFQDYIAKLTVDYKEEMLEKYLSGPIKQALEAVEPEHKDKLQKFVDTVMSRHIEVYFPVLKPVLCHLDFRASNLMSKKREDGSLDIKIVDFQTMQASCPIQDLLYFIFTGSSEEFRGEYFDKLIEHYYTQLSDAMLRLNLDPQEHYSRAVFNYELKKKLPFGLSLAIATLPIVTVEEEDAPSFGESEVVAVSKTGQLYASRLQGVVRDYVKWGLLK